MFSFKIRRDCREEHLAHKAKNLVGLQVTQILRGTRELSAFNQKSKNFEVDKADK